MSKSATPDKVKEIDVFWLVGLVKKSGIVNVVGKYHRQDPADVKLPLCMFEHPKGTLTRNDCDTSEFQTWLTYGIRGVRAKHSTKSYFVYKIPELPVYYRLVGIRGEDNSRYIKARKVPKKTDKDKLQTDKDNPQCEGDFLVDPTNLVRPRGMLDAADCGSKDFWVWISGRADALRVANPREHNKFIYILPEKNKRGATILGAVRFEAYVKESLPPRSKNGDNLYTDIVNRQRRGGRPS